ncbi:ribonuclease R [Thermosipho africanus Ob7]|jgi:ribonuclease R|uniref:Ribonuclease R n=1 Tax=Thermosipho africanus (strain TCF52B) TaxID=484019 RepID=B7IDX4_THEAB|nr:ribonuclease R [Thermosipho africanus]MDK2838778.1 ribonuclease [Thermosipho sp. (in: thermotogales)]ACJ76201.1 rnr ribonuclease R [Thermosipho africanus TCF52B]MDK2900736.1 ribonuclease [Thermosipho sp. (in: thermotogales)]RDI92032.1 ribonuclease R [Thermosipho africanus Ob7]HCF37605.1 ribonuclease R [Thermosipho africanus]
MINKKKLESFFNSSSYKPMIQKEIYNALKIKNKDEKKIVRKLLKELQNEGKIYKDSKGRYKVIGKNMIVGTIEFTRNGTMAFVWTENGEEIAVPAEKAGRAIHKDKVVVEITGKWYDIPEGRVVKILDHGLKKVVGTFQPIGRAAFIIPDDPKIQYDFYVPIEFFNNAKPGEKVVGKIIKYPTPTKNPVAKIIEVLGYADDPATDFPTVVVKHDLPLEFPDKVLKEASKIPDRILEKDLRNRKDFRNEIVVTIDGPDAKDFDDAVSVKKLKNDNYLLGVHIADVSHYVKEGSELDKEAFKRGTSVYLIDRVLPMLPFKLSHGICSLVQGEDRLVMSLVMEIDREGNVVDFEVAPGVIRSHRRLVYDDVNALFKGDKVAFNKIGDLYDQLILMKELKDVLRNARKRRGAILDIEGGEVKIILDEKGNTIDIIPRERGEAEVIIEEFMIKANETIAELFYNFDLPFVYRIHEKPDPDTIIQLKNYLSAIGISFKVPKKITSKLLQELLEKTKNHPLRGSIERLLVRSMKRAVYSANNIGHFGLASYAYTHFTSPIRRYPDLVVHRLIKQFLSTNGKLTKKEITKLNDKLSKIAVHSSKRERVADEAEWDYTALKKIDYISKHIGETFDVVVTAVTKFGLFVEIIDKNISGLIHISTLDDYFLYDEERSILIGSHTGKVFKIGDKLKAKVVNANKTRMQIDFEIAKSEA